ncbi:MAG: ATP-binding protein [Candidatus Hydrogenedentes bacterium]|nr:ATP-binding protein [Candidatus Hydrogenedentota bacterium]
MRDVLCHAQHMSDPAAKRRGVLVRILCDDAITARLHPSLLQQAVLNLVDNAIKYSEEGQQIIVEARMVASSLLITVSDTGTGISSEHLPRLFERFYRVDKARSRDQGGTGLGLAIVKHIAELHGGSVAVKSTPGLGSTFEIRIPVR